MGLAPIIHLSIHLDMVKENVDHGEPPDFAVLAG